MGKSYDTRTYWVSYDVIYIYDKLRQNLGIKNVVMSTGGAKKVGPRKMDEFLDNTSIKPFIQADIIDRANNLKINVVKFTFYGKLNYICQINLNIKSDEYDKVIYERKAG